MKAETFRKLALALPGTEERAHMNHPDFRVGGKIFATLWPDGKTGMVKLNPAQQAAFCQKEPEAYQPVKGAWGRQGCTAVILGAATAASVKRALQAAWRTHARRAGPS